MNKRLLVILYILFLFFSLTGQIEADSIYNSHLRLYTEICKGEYINWYEPATESIYGISYSGNKSFNSAFMEGGLSFRSGIKNNTYWPLYSPEIYPYMLFEESVKTFYNDIISLYGGYYHNVADKLNLGVRTSYINSISYNRSDPRFKSEGYDLEIKPAIRFKNIHFKLSLEPIIKASGSEINMQTQGYNAYEIYHFLGLGHTENVLSYASYTGEIKKMSFGTNALLNYTGEIYQINLKNRYHLGETKIHQSNISWNILNPVAVLNSRIFILEPSIKLNINNILHNFSYIYNLQSKTGQEFIKQDTDSPTSGESWEVYGTTDKYQQTELSHRVSYSVQFIARNQELMILTGIERKQHNERYVGIIKDYHFNYSLTTPYVFLSYNTWIKQNLYAVKTGFSKKYFDLTDLDIIPGIPSEYTYDKEINYYYGNPYIININGTFGTYHKLFGLESFGRIGLNSTFIIPENGQSMRSVVEISLQVDF
ncbi:DUF6850 family outer membrane beta-barrel protein [Saccharicrinis sp. FJH62]|uniref:DUF6850 family outer membrane beta-barrel protein n=1 Tax=Saccharicrinis sp. FJH62 TaxID=3344657 RepID=UPI0035D4DBB4